MPTEEELTELKDNCDWTWTELNGKSGAKVSSRTNSNSIFLPATGFWFGTNYNCLNNGGYWSSYLKANSSYRASGIGFHSHGVWIGDDARCCAYSIRPVRE